MKKSFAVLILMATITISFAQKSSKKKLDEGTAFSFGFYYTNPTRLEFDKYFTVVSESLKLTSSIIPEKTYGLSFAYSMLNGSTEFEVGAGIGFGLKKSSANASKSNAASLSTNTFDIHFGLSKYIAGPFFIGVDLGVLSNNGKFDVTEATGTMFESSPESNNPFKGYVFSVRPKAGFFIPFKAGVYSGIKINAYYDYGISKYEFYNNDIFQSRLKNYTGATKSSLNGFGAQLAFVFGL